MHLSLASATVVFWWTICSLILRYKRFLGPDSFYIKPARWLWAELRPFYLPAVILRIGLLVMSGEMLGYNTLYMAAALANWFLYKDVDDDDRWKRRKAKLVEKIQRQGAHLVVVPAGDRS